MPGLSSAATSTGTRARLAARQRAVLDDLLAGRTPEGFDPRGTSLTTRVLHAKRSAAARRVAPELVLLAGWRPRFHAWAATHPRQGCAHDDVRGFAAWLAGSGERGWPRVHEVYDGRRRLFLGRVGGRWLLALGLGDHVWRLGGRRNEGD